MSSAVSSAAGDTAVSVRLCITLPTVDQRDTLDDIHASQSPSKSTTATNANDHHSLYPVRTPSTSETDVQQGGFRLGSPWTASVATVSLPTADQLNALHELEATRLNSALHPARKRDPTALSNTTAAVERRGRRHDGETRQETEENRAARRSLIEALNPATSPLRAQRRTSFQSTIQQKKRPKTISYAPETLQSVFQSAKPRVYKPNVRTEAPNMTRQVAVVTTTIGGAGSTDVHGQFQQSRANATPPWIAHHQHHQAASHNTHLAIVTLTDEDLAAKLMLDFRASNRKSRVGSAGWDSNHGDGLNGHNAMAPLSLVWSLLDNEHQNVELMAASRSRSVVADARAEEITLPAVAAFSHSLDVKTQLAVRSFTRWFLSIQHSRQRVREAFLREELRFAARDTSVIAALRRAGCAAPPEECIDDVDSREWINFTVWYATGRPYPAEYHFVDHDGVVQLQAERLHDRIAFLRKRLAALEAYDKHASSTQPPPAELFIFDSLPSVHDTAAADSPSNWEKLSQSSQEKELALALLDPTVQIAAIADDVVLPDASVAELLPHCDFLTLAAPFIEWWTNSENIHRQEFLADEIREAAEDESVLEILRSDAGHVGSENPAKTSFMEGYFASTSSSRVNFLTKKLDQFQQNNRVGAITQQGQLPSPILLAAPLAPLLVEFEFPPPPIVTVKVAVEESVNLVVSGRLATERPGDDEADASVAEEELVDDDEASQRRQEEERLLMEAEDALSHQLRLDYESGSDDEQDIDLAPIESPKRTDFTFSYFFGNLPKSYRVNAGGWLAGSGIDNGDEEIEEEERLERERKHQENLDRLEAERLAELEREAVRQRLEKEMDEKALQLRRIRQVELKKILIHQAELEQQRAIQDEIDRMMRERGEMAREEQEMREWLLFIEHERAAMHAEDRVARQIAKAERDARRTEMRRVLAELTLMDMEDRRSAAAQAEQLKLERKQKQRIEYLTDLYEQFEPYYAASSVPSEEMLPVIRHRLDRKQQKVKRTPAKYAMSFAEALALDEVEEEQRYVTRDSRKLRQLLGLPLTTPHSRRMMRIPSEQEIIKTRHELQLMLPPSGDLSEEDRPDPMGNPSTRTRDSPSVDRSHHKTRLPELVHWKSRRDEGDRLSDLKEVTELHTNQNNSSAGKTKARAMPAVATSSQQPTALPFFRGNFIVEGKSRAQTYAHK